MRENIVKTKSFAFALKIVNLFKNLTEKKREFILSKQVLRSGTSVGAMVCESEHAESKADFIHKLSIAQKEAKETSYWIELLFQSRYLDEMEYKTISNDVQELCKILSAIIVTAKERNKL
ncbi:MAG: four helix bundle protein [Gammaproteobacteria bacterium]